MAETETDHSLILRRLARVQAPKRLQEIAAVIDDLARERDAILAAFPHLPMDGQALTVEPAVSAIVPARRRLVIRRVNPPQHDVVDPELVMPAKKKRTMSAAQRRAVSRRMTAYWKARRNGKKR